MIVNIALYVTFLRDKQFQSDYETRERADGGCMISVAMQVARSAIRMLALR